MNYLKHYKSITEAPEIDSALVNKLKSDVAKSLDSKYTVLVRTSSLGRNATYFIDIYHAKVKVTRHNSPVWTAFVLDILPEKVEITSDIYPSKYGIKFRKISASDTNSAVDKLSQWIKNNKSAYDKVLKDTLNEGHEMKSLKQFLKEDAALDKLAYKIDQATENNDHTGACMLLAKAMGKAASNAVELLTKIDKEHDRLGHLPDNLDRQRTAIRNELLQRAKKQFSPEEYDKIERAF